MADITETATITITGIDIVADTITITDTDTITDIVTEQAMDNTVIIVMPSITISIVTVDVTKCRSGYPHPDDQS